MFAANNERATIAKHVAGTATHAAALVEQIRYWPGWRDIRCSALMFALGLSEMKLNITDESYVSS
jgi:hypothetical protein